MRFHVSSAARTLRVRLGLGAILCGLLVGWAGAQTPDPLSMVPAVSGMPLQGGKNKARFTTPSTAIQSSRKP